MESFLANRPVHNLGSRAASPQRLATPDEDFQPLFSASRLAECRQRLLDGDEPSEPATSQVELVQENGQVRRIVVTCGCGERIELECEF